MTDNDIRDLLEDAVSDVEPRRGLDHITARTGRARRSTSSWPPTASTASTSSTGTRGCGARCPACSDVAVRIGVRDDVLVFEWRGTYTAPRPT